MKRDMELVRTILISTEAHEKPTGWLSLDLPGYKPDEVHYHVKILSEAGYLTAQDLTTHSAFCWLPKSLTWEGHEFLDAIRNETAWTKVKEQVKEKGGSIPFEVLKALAIKVTGSLFGLD